MSVVIAETTFSSARSLLVVVSGPSGSGKTSVVNALKKRRNIRKSVSATTRAPRQGEVEGVHYHFLSREAFERGISNGAFAEWARYRDHFYGTLRSTVDDALLQDNDLLMEIDVQGGAQIRARYREAVLVFILPPSFDVLARRLAHRGTESDAVRRERLAVARDELRAASIYDYAIVNEENEVERAAIELDAIIEAERHRLTLPRYFELERAVSTATS